MGHAMAAEVEGRAQAAEACYRAGSLRPHAGRWPPCQASFTSAPAGSGRSGVVAELFARLALIAVGALFLAGVIFSTVPRPQLPAWRGDSRKTIATVGFNDQITLGGLGETIENPQEVMQLKLVDPATRPGLSDARRRLLAGFGGHLVLAEPLATRATAERPGADPASPLPQDRAWRRNRLSGQRMHESAPRCRLFEVGPPVVQQITMEPYLDRDDLFYIWPLMEPVSDTQTLLYMPAQRPAEAEAQLERRAPRRQFQVRGRHQRAGRRASGPAGSGQRRGPRIALSANAQRSLAAAPADGLGRAMAEGKRPAVATSIMKSPAASSSSSPAPASSSTPCKDRSATRRSTPSKTSFPTIPAATASTLPRPWP